MSKFLLRRACIYGLTRKAWGKQHQQWLRGLKFERTADQAIFDDDLLALEQLEERLRTLEAKLAEIADQAPYREPVAWLRCFRGINTKLVGYLWAALYPAATAAAS